MSITLNLAGEVFCERHRPGGSRASQPMPGTRERHALLQGGRRQVVASLFFDVLKLCAMSIMSETAFGRVLSDLHDSFTYVHVLHALCTEMCVLLRRFACVRHEIARSAKSIDLLVYASK